MTKKEVPEVPKHIKEFYDKDTKVKKLVATTEAVHNEAYIKALDAIRDERGQVDYDKLDDVKVQDKFLDKMVDHYQSNAVKRLGLKEAPKDEIDREVLLKQYIGITRGELKRLLRTSKSNYTQRNHEKIRDQLIKKQTGELEPLRHSHFEEEHLGDIVKYTGVEEHVDADKITAQHAADLLDKLKENRGQKLTLSHVGFLANTPEDQGGWGSTVYLTKKAKEELKKKYHP